MKIIASILMLLTGLISVSAQNSIHIENTTFSPGETKVISVNLCNTAEFTAFQLDIDIPQGLSVANNAKGKPDVRLNSKRTGNHFISTNYRDANTLAIAVADAANECITENSGELFSFSIIADSSLERDIMLTLKNIKFFTPQGTQYNLADSKAVITVRKVSEVPGDLDGNGKVNVSDLQVLIHILLTMSTDKSGDINGDGKVTAGDVAALIDIIMGR